jgi:hypothetical protein
MKFSYLGKTLLPLQIALLLLIQSYTLAPLFPSRITGDKASRHLCGCPVEKAAAHSCCCAANPRCCCPCCTGSRDKASPVSHLRPKNPATIFICALPCGGAEELDINSPGKVKFVLSALILGLAFHSAPFATYARKKSDNPFYKPPVPPPETAASSLPA